MWTNQAGDLEEAVTVALPQLGDTKTAARSKKAKRRQHEQASRHYGEKSSSHDHSVIRGTRLAPFATNVSHAACNRRPPRRWF